MIEKHNRNYNLSELYINKLYINNNYVMHTFYVLTNVIYVTRNVEMKVINLEVRDLMSSYKKHLWNIIDAIDFCYLLFRNDFILVELCNKFSALTLQLKSVFDMLWIIEINRLSVLPIKKSIAWWYLVLLFTSTPKLTLLNSCKCKYIKCKRICLLFALSSKYILEYRCNWEILLSA